MTAGWCVRTIRAAVFAAVCVLLAALGHVLTSGSHVPPWAPAAGLAVTAAAGWRPAGRERGLPLIVTGMVAAQTVLHQAFSYARPASGASQDPAAADLSGMGAMDMGSMRMSSMGMSHHARLGHSVNGTDGGSSSCGMLGAHLLAAVLCGLWPAHGEKAAFRILRAVAGRLVAPLRLLLAPPLTPDRTRGPVRRRRSDRAPRLLLLVHALTSRGPPAGTAVV